jgi:predicted dehydrogenase
MSLTPVLLAGTVGMGEQNHQAHMWAPNLAQAGLAPEAVWTPPSVDDLAMRRAEELACACGVELQVSETPTTSAAGAIVCLRGAERTAFAAFAAEHGLPLLLDKPTLDSTAQLEQFAAEADALPVMAGHHFASHPGFARILTAVRGAEIGLLRAVHTDLVTGGGESSDIGELRNLGVHLLELTRLLTGPAAVRLQAHGVANGSAWSFLGSTDRGVVVSYHTSRASAGHPVVQQLRAQVRVTGTHGFLTLDLTKPRLEVRTVHGTAPVAYAGSSVVAHLTKFASLTHGAARTAPATDFVVISRALDGIAASAESGNAASITW